MRADRRPRPFTWGLLATYLAPLAVLVGSVVLHESRDLDFGLVSRDQVQQFHAYPLVGVQSTLGGLAWFSGAVVAFFTTSLLRRDGRGREARTRMLTALGALLLLLGIDDVFLLHDGLGPRYLGIDERPFMLLYVVVMVAVVAVFRRTLLGHEPVLFSLALCLLAGSVLVDHFQEQLDASAYRLFFEDAFKFLGIVGLSGYVIRQSWQALLPAGPLPGLPRRSQRHRRRSAEVVVATGRAVSDG